MDRIARVCESRHEVGPPNVRAGADPVHQEHVHRPRGADTLDANDLDLACHVPLLRSRRMFRGRQLVGNRFQ